MTRQSEAERFRSVGDGSGLAASDSIYPEELQLALRNRGMPLEGLRYALTPTGMHFLLIHFDIPEVDASTWQLNVGGLVGNSFSLTLEDRFLLFKSKDGGFCYLVGLADDAFDEAAELKDGRLGIYPHLKVFLKMGDGHYAEIQKESYGKNSAAYFHALKTAVVPFLTSTAVMLEHTLSKELREAFDMWA